MTGHRLINWIFILYAAALVLAALSFLPDLPWKKGSRSPINKAGRLAIVNVNGVIHFSRSSSAWGRQDADDIARQLHRLSENDDVKAILLRINSPGGTVAAVQEISREILRCKSKGKKVIASMGDVAASGGYYVAAAADRIVADPGTITGSIGVIMEFGNLEGLFQKLGVRLEVVKSGAHKDIGSPARPLTPEERQLLQDSINDAYQQFVDAVVKGRRLPEDKVRTLADGRIFTGRQALKVGLVDELGSRQDAIDVAIRLAHLPARPEIVSETERSFSSLIRQLSSLGRLGALEALGERVGGPTMEYRWK